jgi:hypothetical protein
MGTALPDILSDRDVAKLSTREAREELADSEVLQHF